MQWGTVEFHRQSLKNLGKAMFETKRLCAIMLDTLGREIFVRRQVEIGPDNWPKHGEEIHVAKGGTITLTVDDAATQTDTVFPVNYKNLPSALVTLPGAHCLKAPPCLDYNAARSLRCSRCLGASCPSGHSH